MNNKQFYNSFSFKNYRFSKLQTTNRLKGNGSYMNHIGVLLCGSAEFEFGKDTFYAAEGEMVFIPKGRPYRSVWYPAANGYVNWLSFSFEYYPFLEDGVFPLQVFAKTPEIERLLNELSGHLTVDCTSVGVFYQMLGETIKGLKRSTAPQNITVQKALDFMRDNDRYTVGDVADHCHISESGLYGVFKRVLHKTPVEMKQRILCDRAVDLLTTTNLSVEEISNELGFSSSSYFRKVLKQHTGKNPLAIRGEAEF